jgi:uroporphyrinogen-III decarboxylase
MKAKDALWEKVCIRGGLPISMLAAGTPDEIRGRCKEVIDYAGRDGGFIMDTSTTLDNARPENVRAMVEFTKQYGAYR